MELYTNLQKCISGFLQISFSIHLKQYQLMECIRIVCNNDMVTLLVVESGCTLKYSNVSITQVKFFSKTSRPSILLIHRVRHTSINLQFVLPFSIFFMKICKCFAQMGEKFKKYEMSLITSIKLPKDEILHDVPMTRFNP